MDDHNKLTTHIVINCVNTLQYSFTSHLSMEFRRKGISSFINSKGTLDVIERASTYVVVLSKNYLSSESCLDKLVRVLESRRKNPVVVVPVFYGISPSDVVVPEQELTDRIRKWSSALQELKGLPGHQSREKCSDCDLVEEIVNDVYEQLFPTKQIGINLRLREIEELLCKQPWGIRHIGIWGMPGIGKTTLAKAVFNEISGGYEASCFIEHFDQAFHEMGIHRLLKEHFGKILKEFPRVCSSITRPSLPKDILRKKRTLVVLDDVHNHIAAESFLEGFHWFGPGSLIIITSRDKQVFRLCQINHVYKVQSLNKNEALQLFSQWAFGINTREHNLMDLSEQVIKYAKGNPLALCFYGRELKGKKLSEMETTFLKLKLRTPYKIHELFKSSYETINDNEKNIFLDIACFLNGENGDYVMRVLEACGFLPHVGIDVLVEKCMVTISENRVKMHRLLQDFGREIINGETVQIERRRRLWEPWTIKFLLEDDKLEANEYPKGTYTRAMGTEDIEGIFLDASKLLIDVKPIAFENMLNLRFLKIYHSSYGNHCGLRLPKGLESLPYELRVLHWDYYPFQYLPQYFEPCHLVELNMFDSQLQKLWEGSKNLNMLKIVRLCHSQQLAEIDDICRASNIELIDLQGCIKLKIFPDTSQLKHLRVINLSDCRKVKSIAEVTPYIRELHLQGTSVRELPISIGNTISLQILNLSNCSRLMELPSSFGNIINLKELYLSGCSRLVELPTSIGNAINLKKLDLSNCSSLVKLPSSFKNTINLEELYLIGCSSLVKLPFSFTSKLKKLYLNGCLRLLELPTSIVNACNLEILDLSKCSSLVKLPSSFGNAINLKELYLIGWSSLVELPFPFGINFKEIYLNGCSSLVTLPTSIKNAFNLEIMDLSGCSSLVKLPFLFGVNLKELYLIGCSSLVELSFSFPTNLKKLYLTGCSSLVELPSSLGNAKNLKEVYLIGCSSLVEVPFTFGTNLKKLLLTGCSSLMELPASIGNAINLKILDLSYCLSLHQLPSSLGNAKKLKEVYLIGCSSLVEIPFSFGTNLKELHLTGCSSFVELPTSIGNATNLKILDLGNCSSLVELPFSIGNASSNLQKLNLAYCSSLVKLPSSMNAIKLKELYLNLNGCSSLVNPPTSITKYSTPAIDSFKKSTSSEVSTIDSFKKSTSSEYCSLVVLDSSGR